MTCLRLFSTNNKKEFVIATRDISGYFINPEYYRITLYTRSSPIEVYSSAIEDWDNWDEFVEQVKERFTESNELF